MIHQFIFAGPKPGLAPEAFQSYWLNFHAVDYAAKISQIQQYLVTTREHVSYPREVPFFEGLAEIWLASEAEQIASLQSPEFLNGARADEPRWAAFWQTLVIDTDSRIVWNQASRLREFAKVYVLLKRSPSLQIGAFQEHIAAEHCVLVKKLPGIQRHLIALSRSGLYGLGEPRFDAIEVWSFDDTEAAQLALLSNVAKEIEQSWSEFADQRYIFTFVGREHWIISPGYRSSEKQE